MSLLALEVGLTDSRHDYLVKCRSTRMSFLSRDPVTGQIEIDALVQRRQWQDAENILMGILSEAKPASPATPTPSTFTSKLDDSAEIQSTKLMLAYIFRQVGRPREAERLDAEVLETRQRLLGPDALDTLMAMYHLATDIKQQPGRLLEGMALEKHVLEAVVQVYWLDDTEDSRRSNASSSTTSSTTPTTTTSAAMDILTRMCHLADTFFLQNQAAHAATLHESVLRLCTTSLGPGHPYTIAVMDSTGRDYVSQGRFPEAVRLLQDAVEAGRVHLGAQDSTTQRCVVHLAEAHGRITAEGDGKVPDATAVAILEQGVQILEESIDAEETDTISLKYYLAIAYARLDGRIRDSEALQKQVLHWCRGQLGVRTETANLIVRNLILMYRQLGIMDKAREIENEFGRRRLHS
jgi:Tetratricopeptide repeat